MQLVELLPYMLPGNGEPPGLGVKDPHIPFEFEFLPLTCG